MLLNLIFAFCSLTSANSSDSFKLLNKTVTIKLDNISIAQALERISEQAAVRFFCPDEIIDKNLHLNYTFKNEKLSAVLDQVLTDQKMIYSIRNNVVIVQRQIGASPKSIKKNNTVSGIVVDTSGITLPGVSVILKSNRSIGTTTDVNGRFILEVPDEATLVFTYMGFRSREVKTSKAQNNLTVILHEANSFLEEVTVVGYGTQKKISLVGAQSSVNVKDLKLPVSNLTNSLGGRVAGLVSVQRSGELGFNDAQIYIRGISTFTSSLSAPLTLVDGVPREISNIDPEDIESFSVLKDASATAVYGVRGANGVILITTKGGKPGKAVYNIRYNEGITRFTTLPKLADGITYMQMANEAITTRGGVPVYSDEVIEKTRSREDPYLYPNVNWMDELFNKSGKVRNVNSNISGGTENATFYVGLGYYDEVGLYKTDAIKNYDPSTSLKRYNVSSNLTIKPGKSTEIKLGIQGYLNNVNLPFESINNIFADAYFMTPVTMPLQYPDGKIADIRSGSISNPWASLTQAGYANQWRSQVMSNLRLTQQLPFITKGLSASAMFSFDAYNYTSNRYGKLPDTYLALGRDVDGNLLYDQTAIGTEFLAYTKSNVGSRTVYSEASLNYNRDFGKHSVSGLLLYNQSDKIDTYATSLENSLPYRFRGIAGRATYGYANKYFVDANFGLNGSENFLPDKRYGFFPSGGVAWVLSEEGFFEPLKAAVQLLKFRFSYGKVGNSLIDGRRFAYISTISAPGGYSYGIDMKNTYAGKEFGEYAVDVQWETSKKTNLGLDVHTLKDKLSIQADFYKEYRSGIFLRRKSLPIYAGMINAPFANIGVIDNRGLDASVNYNNQFGKFSLQLLGTFTYNKNKVIENDDPAWKYPWLERKGRPVSQRFGYEAVGLFASDDEVANSPRQTGDTRAGDIKYRDVNADGKIDSYDQVPLGYGNVPRMTYGFGFTVGYKNLSLSTLFQGAAQVDYLISGEAALPFQQGLSRGNLMDNIADRWTIENPNPNAFYPRLGSGSINDNFAASSWWVKKADYLRLKTLQLSYSLPKSWTGSVGIKSANIFLQGVNLVTFSSFKLWDVELDNGRGDKYPNTASYTAGLAINF
ncbi:TonB-dependent receptor [Arcticibacter svalbardensis MN12-7]|uniref:TonB-dependent receptor n=1 Tax=Arcticibacter svalbardensis MN12-7 TaxID=1150600 RepID=R9GZ65_9SPHI|nr:TonB-dependent receptor [Arcticibacter svalbardensis MN12-7]